MVPQLLRKRAKSQTYSMKVGLICRRCVPCILGYCTSNCIVETPIEGAKFIDRYGRSGFNGQIRDGLADIAVVPNNLLNRESLKK